MPNLSRHRRLTAVLVAVVLGFPWWAPLSSTHAQAPGFKPAESPQASQATTLDPDGLIRYVPNAHLSGLLEFQGIDNHEAGWKATNASKILNDTNTGAMIEEILSQVFNQTLSKIPDIKITAEDHRQMMRHLARAGFVVSLSWDPAPGEAGEGLILVVRDALRDDVKTVFAHLVSQIMAGATPTLEDRPGGRRIAVVKVGPGGGFAWWVENRKDLVICLPLSHVDDVINTLEGKTPSARENPRRARLASKQAEFEPIAWLFADMTNLPPLPASLANSGLDKLKSVQWQWGAEGRLLTQKLDIEAPKPRTGLLTLLDQPGFQIQDLPAMPESISGYGALAVDFPTLPAQIKSGLNLVGQSETADRIDQYLESFRAANKLDLQTDVLDLLGSKLTYYLLPPKKTNSTGDAEAVNPLLGFAVPRVALLIDARDVKGLNKIVTKLMGYVGKQLAAQPASPETDTDTQNPPQQPGGAAGSGKAGHFALKMTSPRPVTYQLTIPEPFRTMLSLRPTFVLASKNVILATNPDVATEALGLEGEAAKEGSGATASKFSEVLRGLPASLSFLHVVDASEGDAAALNKFPATINQGLATYANNAGAWGFLGQKPAGAPPEPAPGQPPAPAPPMVPVITIQLDPGRIPTVESLKPLLTASCTALSTDDEGMHLVTRGSFLGVTSLSGLIGGMAGLYTNISLQGSGASPAPGAPPGP